MSDKQFDDLFKNKLRNIETGVPEDMWQRIIGKEDRKKADVPLKRYLALLLLLLLGVTGGYFLLINKGKKTSNTVIQASEQKPTINEQPVAGNNKTQVGQTVDVDFNAGKNKIRNARSLKRSRTGAKIFNSNSENVTANDTQEPGPAMDKQVAIGNDVDSIDALLKKPVGDKDIAEENLKGNDSSANNIEPIQANPDRFSIELYGAAQLPFIDQFSTNQQYQQVLQKAGSARLSFSAGTRIKIHITSKISAKFGLEYLQVNEKVAFINSQNGQQVNISNKYKFIKVPILMSYRTNWLPGPGLSINAGLMLNLSSKYQGIIPSTTSVPMTIEKQVVYNAAAGAMLYVGFDVARRFLNRTDLFLEPYVLYSLKNMATRYQPFKQKLHSLGVSIGIRHPLFKK